MWQDFWVIPVALERYDKSLSTSISYRAGKVQMNFGTLYLGNYNFLEEARQRQNGYICQFVPPSFIHPSHVHISRYRATSIGELAISGGTK